MNLGILAMIGGRPQRPQPAAPGLRQRGLRLDRQPGLALSRGAPGPPGGWRRLRAERRGRGRRRDPRRGDHRASTAAAPASSWPASPPRSSPRRASPTRPRRSATVSRLLLRDAPVKAVILAAGVARRLAPLTDHTHKCLLPVGGRSLLDRMLDALAAAGVDEAVLVVGHCQDQVRRAAGSARGAMRIGYVENPDYQKGSILSLWCARDTLLRDSTLIMDADVLFPDRFLRGLIDSPARERAAARPRLPGHRGGSEALRGGRPGDRPRQEVRAAGLGRGRRGRRLLQVQRGPRARVHPPDGGVHPGDRRRQRVRGRPPPPARPRTGGLGGRDRACRGPRWTSRRTCAGPRRRSSPRSSVSGPDVVRALLYLPDAAADRLAAAAVCRAHPRGARDGGGPPRRRLPHRGALDPARPGGGARAAPDARAGRRARAGSTRAPTRPRTAAARWLLLPASALIHVSALEGLLAAPAARPAVLAASAGGTAPVALVPAPPAAALWPDRSGRTWPAGRPVGPELARWLREAEAVPRAADGPLRRGARPGGPGPRGGRPSRPRSPSRPTPAWTGTCTAGAPAGSRRLLVRTPAHARTT